MNRDSFVFRKDWMDAISGLPDDVRLEIYEAIIEYGTTGEVKALKPMARLAFNFVKTELDKDKVKYEAMCERNKANRNKAVDHSSPVVTSCDHSSPVVTNNDNDNDYDIKEEPPKGGKKKDALSSSTHTPLELLQKRKEKFYNELLPYVKKYGKEMVRAFFDYWTEPNKSKSKMRFELEKTWDLSRRLATWDARDNTFKNGKAQSTKPDIEAIQQREDENAERERRYEEMRRNSVSRKEAMQSEEYKRALEEA